MQSELHKRLSHLIQYSSGLIFIKSEPEFSISTCIDALLAEQDDSDEVAIITAKPSMLLNDFRQQLTQQLSSKLTPHSGNAPLAKLIAPSVGHTESTATQGLMICISKGENLSTSMLEELQQLVLTLHSGSERQVNVLVFAQRQWVNQTYQGFANKNNVIVVDAGTNVDHESAISGSELEQLIANKRQAFAQRIEQRNQPKLTEAPSMMQRRWFLPVVCLLFIVIFSSILLSQYPELLSDSPDEEDKKTMQAPEPARDGSTKSTQTEGPVIAPTSEFPSTPNTDAKKHIEVTPQNEQASDFESKEPPQPGEDETVASSVGDPLISDWNSESKRIDENKKNMSDLSLKETNKLAAEEKSSAMPVLPDLDTDTVQTGALQKPFAADIPATEQSASAPQANARKPVHSASATDNNFQFDEAKILALPKDGYVLQVIGFSVRNAIQAYLTNNNIEQHVWVYQTKRYNDDWYVLLYNKHYPSLAAALDGVSSLPQGLHDATPFPKALQKVHQEIESAN
ncbi:Cell division protein DamX [Paraglaciecola mesophila]|uniref:Cell division protein DamX n=1 Tax=Paraglaciecola mesophila TaxID=197222 RepID=A0A857JI35_9ALTE|nr:DamX protein [Paraglaciecola mesophila]QHJ11685.1 Cell division protein DamX [Paraglaciecola mesophila]